MSMRSSHIAQNLINPLDAAFHVNNFKPQAQKEVEKIIDQVLKEAESHEWRKTKPGSIEGYSTDGRFGCVDVVKVSVEDDYFDPDTQQLDHVVHHIYLARLSSGPGEGAELITESRFSKVASTYLNQEKVAAEKLRQMRARGTEAGSLAQEIVDLLLPK